MGSFSDYCELKVLDHVVGKAAFTMPTHLWIALYTTICNDASTGTTPSPGVEVSAAGYARVDAVGAAGFNVAASSGQTANSVAITFGAPTANWGTIVGFAAIDASTGGNILFWGAVSPSKTVNNGNAAPSFAINALTLSLD
jgi:hypothetical protein